MSLKIIIVASAFVAATPSLAQSVSTAEQTSDDLVCQLSGDCDGDEQLDATRDKPESRGFKIARKVPATETRSASVPSIKARATGLAVGAGQNSAAAAKPGRSRTIAASSPQNTTGRATLRVTFVTASAELTESGRREADKFLAALTAPSLAGKRFRIEGHTDSLGSRESNVELSKRRGLAVVEYLAANGADPELFSVIGYGPDKPLAGLGAGASANRRVEIVLVP